MYIGRFAKGRRLERAIKAEVDMAPGGVPGGALVSDHLAGLDVLTDLDFDVGPLVGVDAAISRRRRR